ncbi:MAG: MogA/MoaB family molybdenum cofactor biosynthesis protein [Anaerolineae bacterium]|nr:MogA/MoaB family molybdenum cofactor biosynthesis protein [Anaerolineae bacterium]
MPIRAAVVTVSDKGYAGVRQDASGPLLSQLLRSAQVEVLYEIIVPDDQDRVADTLRALADRGDLDLVLTTGGTGPAPRDWTPEATRQVVHRDFPGLAELLRWEGYKRTPRAVLSRGVAGLRGRCIIVNLPGSPRAVREGMEVLAPLLAHAVQMARGDNLEHRESAHD